MNMMQRMIGLAAAGCVASTWSAFAADPKSHAPYAGEQARAINDPQVLVALAITRDRTRIAVAGADHSVRIYQLNNGQQLASLDAQATAIKTLAFSADHTKLVTTVEKGATTWEVASGALLETVPGEGFTAAAFVGDAKTLVTCVPTQIQQHRLKLVWSIAAITQPITSLACPSMRNVPRRNGVRLLR